MKMLLVVLLLDAGGNEVKRTETQVPNLSICRLAEQAVVANLSSITFDGKHKLKTDCRSVVLAHKGQLF